MSAYLAIIAYYIAVIWTYIVDIIRYCIIYYSITIMNIYWGWYYITQQKAATQVHILKSLGLFSCHGTNLPYRILALVFYLSLSFRGS